MKNLYEKNYMIKKGVNPMAYTFFIIYDSLVYKNNLSVRICVLYVFFDVVTL